MHARSRCRAENGRFWVVFFANPVLNATAGAANGLTLSIGAWEMPV